MPLNTIKHSPILLVLIWESTKKSIFTLLKLSALIGLLLSLATGLILFFTSKNILASLVDPTNMIIFFSSFILSFGLLYFLNKRNRPSNFFIFDADKNLFTMKQDYLDDKGKVVFQSPIKDIQRVEIKETKGNKASLTLKIKKSKTKSESYPLYKGEKQQAMRGQHLINDFLLSKRSKKVKA